MTVFWEGRPLPAQPGQSLAAALWAAGVRDLGPDGEPARGLACGVGHCFACRVAVDGTHGVRACLAGVREGMRAARERSGTVGADAGGGPGAADGTGAGGPVSGSGPAAGSGGVQSPDPGDLQGGSAETGTAALGTSGSGVGGAARAQGMAPARAAGRPRRVAVLGAGPAGLSAAALLAELGALVTVVDEAPAAGGALRLLDPGRAEALGARARAAGAHLICGASVWGLFPAWRLALAPADPGAASLPAEVAADAAIVASGAVQRPLALPGWTLPGVVSPWGALHLLRWGALPPGTRVAVVGTDVATLAAARVLHAAQPALKLVAVLAPEASDLVPVSPVSGDGEADGLPHQPGRMATAFLGGRHLEAVRTRAVDGADAADVAADLAVAGAGLAPLCDAVQLAGGRVAYVPALGGFCAVHGPSMQTRPAGLFVAGATSGVEGTDVAIAQGRLAGVACAAALGLLSEAAAGEQRAAAAAELARAEAGHASLAAARSEVARRWAAEDSGTG